MDVRRVLIWLFLRNTDIGRRLLSTKKQITQGEVLRLVRLRQEDRDIRWEHQRASGHKVIQPIIKDGWIGDERALIKFFERGDANRVDIYYGGDGQPDGSDHGHIHMRLSDGEVVSWQEPGANKDNRNRLY